VEHSEIRARRIGLPIVVALQGRKLLSLPCEKCAGRSARYAASENWRAQVRAELISLQAGIPRTVQRHGQEITTGIYKMPIEKRIQLHALNLEGDEQADLSAHGGQDKAVYAYPSEHYPYWKKELPGLDLPWGAFGENFTTKGLLEDEVCLGDRLTIGTAEVVVTQPRIPCFKLNIKFESDLMVKRFLSSRRTGFYLRVLREGEVASGDEIVRIHQDENRVSISDALRVYLHDPGSNELIHRALRVEYLSAAWREDLRQTIYPHQHDASASE
jgi:MOSC domain-containing protein YiiM